MNLVYSMAMSKPIKKILVDIGSSTVKVYGFDGQKPELLETKSLPFREDFSAHKGISNVPRAALITYINEINARYKLPIETYATAIFRKIDADPRERFVEDFYNKTGVGFNIVPHDLEGHYLELALAGKYVGKMPILLINIGGGSTELAAMRDGRATERYNLDLGVMTVLSNFPRLNDSYAGYGLNEVVDTLARKMPKPNTGLKYAIYNGGELTYMRLTGYALKKNNLFKDNDHPSVISQANFTSGNKRVFADMTIQQLEELMPRDPKWMHGARACSAIAQAVCERFGIEVIIPSDSNMIDGVCRQSYGK